MEEAGFAFGRWRLLPASRQLLADGKPVALGSRAFDVLLALVEAQGELVSKDALLQRVWPCTVVEENNLQVQVSALRRVLGQGAERLIATIPGRGYRFTGDLPPRGPTATGPTATGPAATGPAATGPAATGPAPDAAGPDRRAENVPVSPLASGRPVLVVLPFADMTGDTGQEYFADGITEDLTTALSHLRWFSVISRNSAFTYKGRAVDVRQIGRELGVGYVLQGSVRKAGGRVRITAQLSEAETGRHVWAERFDGDLADVFGLQDRVTEAVACAIEPSLRSAEIERTRTKPTESLGAYDLYLRSLPHRYTTRADNDEALRLLRRALQLDPGFSAAKGALAGQLVLRVTQGWAGKGDVEEGARCAREVVDAGGADDPTALAWAAHALVFLGRDYEGGLAASNRALRLAPNSGMALYLGAWSRLYVGDWRTAVAWTERAVRLSPVDPSMSYFAAALSAAYFVGERYEDSVEWARRAAHDQPRYLVAHRLLAASLALLGRPDEARRHPGPVGRRARLHRGGGRGAHPPPRRDARTLSRRAAARRAARIAAANAATARHGGGVETKAPAGPSLRRHHHHRPGGLQPMLPCQRALFDMPREICYLNAAGWSPLPFAVQEAGRAGVGRKGRPWELAPDFAAAQHERARAAAARLVNADPADIALIPSVGYGVSTAGKALGRLPAGSRVLVLEDDHSSPVLEWVARAPAEGFVVETVRRPGDGDWTAALLEAIERPGAPPVAVASVSSVHWSDGGALALEGVSRLLRARGAALVVDATHAVGVMRTDVEALDPDFLVFPTYKWVLGPYGRAFLYVAKRRQGEGVPPLEQTAHGRRGVAAERVPYLSDLSFAPGARRFDMGERDHFVSLEMASVGMEMMAGWGHEAVSARLRALTDRMEAGLRLCGSAMPAGSGVRSAAGAGAGRAPHLLCLEFPEMGMAGRVVERLAAEGIHVAARLGRVRVSPHVYNDEADADRFVEAFRRSVQ